MKVICRLGNFLLAVLIATSYAIFAATLTSRLQGVLIAWPINVVLVWLLLEKFKLHRFVGFILVPPVALLGFQFYVSRGQSSAVADKFMVYDRSHYVPGTKLADGAYKQNDPDAYGWQLAEVLIGTDGFRADPASGSGNPKNCRYVLIGDSMVYGSGLLYAHTLGPVLQEIGLQACVFGVTGNSPADYLSTLHFVADRIAADAYVAFYIYAYNDFVGLNKYLTRRTRGYTRLFPALAEWTAGFDRWRRGTIMYSWLHAPREAPATRLWRYPIGDGKSIELVAATDPSDYQKPPALDTSKREMFQYFLDGVRATAKERQWQIAMVIHPDHSEIYANLARGRVFEDLDPRRAGALEICQAAKFICQDISGLLFDQMISQGRNPFFTDDRHFSRFGTRIVAQHFVSLVTRASATSKSQQ